jgi:predicted kinase
MADLKLRRKYYNLCDPKESLEPDDKRNVDIDAANQDSRGRNWVDALANKIELSTGNVCEFFTGLPGSGKSTELKRLAARLAKKDGANLLAIVIDAEEVLDIYNPIDVPDILIAILYKTDEAVLTAEGKNPKDALKEGRFRRFWHWLTTTEVELKSVEAEAEVKAGIPEVAEASAGGKAVLDLKANPSLRERVRAKVAAHMTTFVAEVEAEIEALNERAKKRGHEGIVILFDSLEKLRGISQNWKEVLTSAERVFTGGAPYLRLPVHVLYTLPPAVVLRLNVQVHFLPMLKLFDRESGERDAGFEAAWRIVRQRIPDEHLKEFFGPTSWKDRVDRLITWSGGYPRDIVRLLQNFVAEPTLDEAKFKRLLALAADDYRRTVPENALPWLARVAAEKRLIILDDQHRETVDLMLQNNAVLRYQNGEPWVDLHPAVRELLAEIERAAAERLQREAAEQHPPKSESSD